MARVLYLSYDGALDPLGRSQVVPYLEGLAGKGHQLHLLTFEKPRRWADGSGRDAMEARLSAAGVVWHPLPYHRRPPVVSTARDLLAGYRAARRIVERERIGVLHARSYPPALLARLLAERYRIPWIFDMRGLWGDERVDGGLWRRNGVLHLVTRRVERDLLAEADAIVTLTEASLPVVRDLMERAGAPSTPLSVIPTCVDTDRFRPAKTKIESSPPTRRPVLAYLGSVGTWYLMREMVRLGRVWVEAGRGGGLLFLVNQEEDQVRREALKAGVPADVLEVRTVTHEEVPAALAEADATYFLIRPAPSKVASAATKFGESLAVGLPVIVNDGVGDAAAVAREDRVGVVVAGFHEDAYRAAVRDLRTLLRDPSLAARCRSSALSRYSLADGVSAYDRIYRRLAAPSGDDPK